MHRILLLAALLAITAPATAVPVATSFPYQGRLELNGAPYDGLAQFWVQMYDQPGTGTLIGEAFPVDVPVADGLFRMDLDFGQSAFDGNARWLDIYVMTAGEIDWTLLSPPVQVAAVPYALHALSGGTGSGPWQVDGPRVTTTSGVGILGFGAPFASGKGVFFEGGIPTHANIFAYDYDGAAPLPLILNIPGGNVGIGTATPTGRLHVESGLDGTAIVANNLTSLAPTIRAENGWPGGVALEGHSNDGRGVAGWVINNGWGVSGTNTTSGTYGLLGTSIEGVAGFSPTAAIPGGRFINAAPGGIGLEVVGNARVKTLTITGGADLAERFATAAPVEPGTVMAIDPESEGRLQVVSEAYCRRVAGVVSGANSLAAGVTLGESESDGEGTPIALSGRVWVKCDASERPIRPGDLLTTAPRIGHAMVARDPARTPGAVLGKAMGSLEEGTGLVLVLVSLQ